MVTAGSYSWLPPGIAGYGTLFVASSGVGYGYIYYIDTSGNEIIRTRAANGWHMQNWAKITPSAEIASANYTVPLTTGRFQVNSVSSGLITRDNFISMYCYDSNDIVILPYNYANFIYGVTKSYATLADIADGRNITVKIWYYIK